MGIKELIKKNTLASGVTSGDKRKAPEKKEASKSANIKSKSEVKDGAKSMKTATKAKAAD